MSPAASAGQSASKKDVVSTSMVLSLRTATVELDTDAGGGVRRLRPRRSTSSASWTEAAVGCCLSLPSLSASAPSLLLLRRRRRRIEARRGGFLPHRARRRRMVLLTVRHGPSCTGRRRRERRPRG